MNMRHLRYFVTVAERLSFTAAAKQLGIAQPPLSVQIRNLETDMGAPLFHREHRRIRLTSLGRLLLEEARELLRLADRAKARLQDATEGRAGEIRLNHTHGALSERVTRRIRKFLRKNRGIRLVTTRMGYANDPLHAFANSDVCIVESLSPWPDAILLEKTAIQIALPPKHRLADRSEISLSDLIGESLILSPFESRSPAEVSVAEAIESQGITLSLVDGPSDFCDRMWLVSLGMGISICAGSARPTMDAVCLPLAEAGDVLTLALPSPSSRAMALAPFLEAIRE